jgi:hypothetical protein
MRTGKLRAGKREQATMGRKDAADGLRDRGI